MSDNCNAFLEQEQPVNDHNMQFWQKLYVTQLLEAAECLLGSEVQFISAKSKQISVIYLFLKCSTVVYQERKCPPTYSGRDFWTTRIFLCSSVLENADAFEIISCSSTGNDGLGGWAFIGTSMYFPVNSFQLLIS